MEIVLVVLVVLIMVGVYFFKKKLPTRVLFPISLLLGIGLLIWAWAFLEGGIPWKILITVLILSGLYTTFRNWKSKRVGN